MKAFTDVVQALNTHPPEFPYRSSPSSWKDQETAWKVQKARSKLFSPGVKPPNIGVLFFFGWVAFPEQPSVSHCSRANKAAAEGDSLLQWSWLHTLSNLHNLPHNLNQLKHTPGDYIQKPIWKNIHCLSLKKSRGKEAEWPRLQLMKRKKQKKATEIRTWFSLLSPFFQGSLYDNALKLYIIIIEHMEQNQASAMQNWNLALRSLSQASHSSHILYWRLPAISTCILWYFGTFSTPFCKS